MSDSAPNSELPTSPLPTSPKAPRTFAETDLEAYDGGELLRGATLPDEEDDGDGLPTEWTPENAAGEEETIPDTGKRIPESEEQKPETKPEAESPEATAEKEAKSWPESAQKRVDELARERDELKTKLTEKESGVRSQESAPPADSPLANVHDEAALAAHADFAELAEEWADENREGGELPRALQAVLQGVKASEITEPLVMTAADAAQLLKNARRMQRRHIPARREYLTQVKATDDWVSQVAPEMLDSSTTEAQLFAGFEQLLPGIKAHPAWKQAVVYIVRGHLATQAALAAKKAPAKKPDDPPPLAPVPPAAAASRGAVAPRTARPNRAVPLRADMSTEELAETM